MNRKSSLFIVSLIFILTGLAISCGKTGSPKNGYYVDVKAAEKAAREKGQDVLVIAVMPEDDLFSSNLISGVLQDSRFKDEIASEYIVLVMDFSKKAYEATVFNDESTKEERKIAEENAEIMQQNTLLASRLNLQLTPAIFLMSKEMYYIEEVDFLTDEVSNYDSFKALIEKQKSVIEEFKLKVKAVESDNVPEKLAAIDNLFESTDLYYRPFLIDLIKEYINIDKKNESGLLSKYLLAKADIESSNYFLAGDVGSAVKIYADVAKDLRLEPEHRQNAYYLAAYILVSSQSQDFGTIKEYLQSAIDACPDSPNTETIKMVLDQLNQLLAAEAAQNSLEITE